MIKYKKAFATDLILFSNDCIDSVRKNEFCRSLRGLLALIEDFTYCHIGSELIFVRISVMAKC